MGFARPVHREKAPTMAHHYIWGSKALNIANNTIYSQYSVKERNEDLLIAVDLDLKFSPGLVAVIGCHIRSDHFTL